MGLAVVSGGFPSMVRRLHVVTVGGVSVMCGLLVIAGLMVLGGFAMMIRRQVMMVGGLTVMVRGFLRHCEFLSMCDSSGIWQEFSGMQMSTRFLIGKFLVNRAARGERATLWTTPRQ